VNELDTKRADFDPAQFRATLERAINRLDLPKLKLRTSNVTERISRAFKGEIRSSDQIDQLKRQFNQALTTVFEQLDQSFSTAVVDVESSLKKVQQGLQQDLTQSVQEELAGVKQDFANQQKVLDDYKALLKLIDVPKSTAVA
jgi:BMFP domain-containing protein YqiC